MQRSTSGAFASAAIAVLKNVGAGRCGPLRQDTNASSGTPTCTNRPIHVRRSVAMAVAVALTVFLGEYAQAEGVATPDQGKLLATGGFSQVEGSGGGGLPVWALITGYGTRDSYGANIHYTYIGTQDYMLNSPGVAVGLFERVELSYAYQQFKGTSAAFDGDKVSQNIFGLKVKLFGDAVYEQDNWLPQVAVGLQYKQNKGISGLEALGIYNPTDIGAKSNNGTDYYIVATKLFLEQNLLVSGALRFTKANQFGLAGFGGDLNNSYKAQFEGTLAYLATRQFAIGGEYRTMPHNLSIDNEQNVWDVFVAWYPTKHISVVAAYLELGPILSALNSTHQRGPYVSLQVGF